MSLSKYWNDFNWLGEQSVWAHLSLSLNAVKKVGTHTEFPSGPFNSVLFQLKAVRFQWMYHLIVMDASACACAFSLHKHMSDLGFYKTLALPPATKQAYKTNEQQSTYAPFKLRSTKCILTLTVWRFPSEEIVLFI